MLFFILIIQVHGQFAEALCQFLTFWQKFKKMRTAITRSNSDSLEPNIKNKAFNYSVIRRESFNFSRAFSYLAFSSQSLATFLNIKIIFHKHRF